MLAVANEPRFAAVPPARIVPMLADEGIYLASESTFSRVLKAHGQTAHRGRAKAPKQQRPPTTHIATEPRQVWCWDMTYLPAQVQGRWFHLYLILDLYSRKIVGWEVHDIDHADHAAHLVRRTALAEGIATFQRCRERTSMPAVSQAGFNRAPAVFLPESKTSWVVFTLRPLWSNPWGGYGSHPALPTVWTTINSGSSRYRWQGVLPIDTAVLNQRRCRLAPNYAIHRIPAFRSAP